MKPLICHLLIGPPACGKSTLAQQWVARSPRYCWISTDQIRLQLWGDAAHQGAWDEVEAIAFQQLAAAIAAKQSVIYDATNAKRSWRLALLQRFCSPDVQWMGWHFTTSLETCKAQNAGRDRQVPETVIERYYNWLQTFPPIAAEGFAAVYPVPLREGEVDFEQIEQRMQQLPRTVQNRTNKNMNCELHPYSKLLDFERLIYLIAALMHYPGLGNLQQTNPALLHRELRSSSGLELDTSVAEISAFIASQYGEIYADPVAVQQHLDWLQRNGVVNAPYTAAPFDLPGDRSLPLDQLHRYSDREAFERLMQLIRFIAHHPQLQAPTSENEMRSKSLQGLMAALETAGHLQVHYTAATIRKDVEEVLKPYGLMTARRMRQGYFVGTGILSATELLRVYHCLEGQAKHLSDPIALAAYETFQQRLKQLGLDIHESYPIRKILDQPIVNPRCLSGLSLAQSPLAAQLETAIQTAELIELRRIVGTGRFAEETNEPFEVLPLQIVFYNIAWYLGYQRLDDGLFRYERLDRLTARFPRRTRSHTEQKQALQQLEHLRRSSYGLFLGNRPADQQKLLSPDATVRAQIMSELELWFTTELFQFISEGTQRFPGIQMSVYRPLGISLSEAEREVFTLKGTSDARFPHRLKATLPCWTIDSIDLKRWILSYGDQVKVMTPEGLVKTITGTVRELGGVYEENTTGI